MILEDVADDWEGGADTSQCLRYLEDGRRCECRWELGRGGETARVLDPYVLLRASSGDMYTRPRLVRLAASNCHRAEKNGAGDSQTSRPERRGPGWETNPGLSTSFPAPLLSHLVLLQRASEHCSCKGLLTVSHELCNRTAHP